MAMLQQYNLNTHDTNRIMIRMAEIFVTKDESGVLVPATNESRLAVERMKTGELYGVSVKKKRSAKFLRKWITLLEYAFDLLEDVCPYMEVGGKVVKLDFERFRYDITIMSGFCLPVFNARMEMQLIPESISFANMDEDRFEKLYNASIDVIVNKVLNQNEALQKRGITMEKLSEAVDHIVQYSGNIAARNKRHKPTKEDVACAPQETF